MIVEFNGVIRKVGEIQKFGTDFRVQELLVEVQEGEYVNVFPVQFWGDRIPKDEMKQGDFIEVKAALRSRQAKDGRMFLSLRGFKVNIVPALNSQTPEAPAKDPLDNSDIPF